MKKLMRITAFLIVALILTYCEADFSPKGEFSERYSLNSIIANDTTTQIVTLYQSYDVEGLDPFQNDKDNFISDCFVRIWRNNDEVYILKENTIDRTDTSRYKDQANFYFTDSFQPKANEEIIIEALLPNGRRLKSSTRLPELPSKDLSLSDLSIPPEFKDFVRIGWSEVGSSLIYAPNITIVYFKKEGSSKIRKVKRVPLNYIEVDGALVPNYPLPSKTRYLDIEMSSIDKAMREISLGDTLKTHYTILSTIVEVLVYDRNLSGYYSSTGRIADSYSIRLDDTDFTNVEGGFGVFGSYVKAFLTLKFEEDYILSFGYLVGL